MLARFSMAALFTILVALGRPVATGGAHDLVAVGVVRVEADGTERVILTVPTAHSLEAYEKLLDSPARNHLLHGGVRTLSIPEGSLDGVAGTLREISFFGVRSRAGVATITFGPEVPAAEADPGMEEAAAVARSIAALSPAASAAAARVVVQSPNQEAFTQGLRALVQADPMIASTVARETALPATGHPAPADRRIYAISVLKELGGRASFPGEFARLDDDADAFIRAAAK